MRQETPAKTWMLLAAVLLTAPVLSGCFGGDDAPEADDGLGDGVVVEDDGSGPKLPTNNVSKSTDHSGAKNEPSAHFHHYWGDPPLPSVPIYDGKVPFQNWNSRFLLSHNTLAWADFGLEDDENDVADPVNDNPIPSSGIADTVFAGTDRITVQFPDEFPPGVSGFLFFYKASNTPLYLPEGGMEIVPGDVKEIKLNEVGMTDPPHQFTASRWKFRLIAQNAVCQEYQLEGSQCPPTVIQEPPQSDAEESTYEWGSRGSGLVMIAHNGGQKALDPPHPDFWKGAESIPLGSVERTVDDPALFTPVVRERVPALTDIAMPPNNIVPLGTDYVEVKMTADNTAPGAENVKLDLWYHAADDIVYQKAELDTQDGDTQVYKIYDPEGTLVDPPYESNSFWRFKVVPAFDASGNAQENMGAFQGSVNLEFTAYKKAGFILT